MTEVRRPAVLALGTQRGSGRAVIAGLLPVALILGLSRWGSTIGFGSLYLTDLLIAFAVLHSALVWQQSRWAQGMREVRYAPLPPIFVVFLLYVLARVLVSFGSSPVLDWIRDSVPYFYGVLAIMSATSYQAAGAERRDRTARILVGALVVHLLWSSVVQLALGGETTVTVPLVGAPLFQPRPDIEAALNAVLAGVCLRAIIVHRYRLVSAAGLGLASVTILAQGTRAGLLALVFTLTMSFVVTYSGLGRLDGRRVAMTLAAPAILLVAVIVLPLTPPGQRLVATIFPDQASSESQHNAEGTANARTLVWNGVIQWTEESTPRLFVGSGFGNNFLAESQTLQYLEGTDFTNVRSPHDYWIGSFARLGLLGAALLLWSVLLAVTVIVRARVRISADPLASLCSFVVIAIIPVASLGVVMEAPFGAVPFFWAMGVVYTFRLPDDGVVREPARPLAVSRRRVRPAVD